MSTSHVSSSGAAALLQAAQQVQNRVHRQAAAIQQVVEHPNLPGSEVRSSSSSDTPSAPIDIWA
ncbi:hypothetical protein [Methylogaea oryzae]|uniref:hypothetical protein n=1 Tax=Methylogaea oryzae TaxID=1295382 RepID=UPI0006CF53A3|nr:hypothetical protein [Methylogaea oryzae]